MPTKRSLTATPRVTAFVLLLLSMACAPHSQAQQPPKVQSTPAQASKEAKPAPPQLAAFAAERVIVMPVQMLHADTGSFITQAMWADYRKVLDDSIASAISERGIGKGWGYPADVVRQAKRNAAYVGDPYSVGAQPLRDQPYKPGDRIPDVMFSNLRGLIALGNTRFALMPVELVIQRDGPRQRAVLRLALIDGRLGEFLWVGQAASDPVTSLTPAMMSSLAARVADFVAAR